MPNSLPNSEPIYIISMNDYQGPSTVMQTAVIPTNGSNSLQLSWEPNDPKFLYYAYLYFSEFENVQANNQTREIIIYINGIDWFGPFSPLHFAANTIYSTWPILTAEKIEFSINTTESSTLPPILNAYEIYRAKEFLQFLTNQQDGMFFQNIF